MAGALPSVRNASDNIRNAMNMLMEVGCWSVRFSQQLKWRVIPDSLRSCHLLPQRIPGPSGTENGGPVVAVMITGILLNVLYWFGCSFRLKEGTYEDVSSAKPDAIEAQQKQFALVDTICRHFPGASFLPAGIWA